MKHAVIIKNVTDLRAEPNFRSERKSQLLYNEIVSIGAKRNGYYRATMRDRYDGYVSENAIKLTSSKDANEYNSRLNYVVRSLRASPDGDSKVPAFLHYLTQIAVISTRNGLCNCVNARGSRFTIKRSLLIPTSRKIVKARVESKILKESEKFLGVQYLWGGKTPHGLDCSGLVQLVYGRFGIDLPRDSKDQRKCGAEIARENIKRGDLLFFPGHVAIAYDKKLFIHASLKEGGVAINSFDPNAENYRADLDRSLDEIRRVTS